MLHPIVQKMLTKLLFFFWLVVTAPPVMLIAWIVHSQQNLFIGIPLLLVWILGIFWLTFTMARHMIDENRLFLPALKYTLYDLRLMFAFLPVVAALFEPDEDKTKNDDDAV
jgi:membrane protease YdiL (CAAX protease family)